MRIIRALRRLYGWDGQVKAGIREKGRRSGGIDPGGLVELRIKAIYTQDNIF